MLGDSQVTISDSREVQMPVLFLASQQRRSALMDSYIKLDGDVILQVSYFQIAHYNYPELFMSH